MTIGRFWASGLLVVAMAAVGCSSGGSSDDAGSQSDGGQTSNDDGGTTDGGTGPADGGTFVDQNNHSFATAKAIKVDREIVLAKLPSATSGGDYYSFTANKGDTLLLLAYAQILDENGNGSDPTRLDTVITLFDSNQTQIAQGDDPWPRFASDSELFFMVPATGTYYFLVQDCHATNIGSCGTTTPSVTNFDYETAVFHVARLNFPEMFAGSNQDGTTAKAVTVAYAPREDAPDAGNGKVEYGRYVIDGRFNAKDETHVFSFTPPADLNAETTAPITAEFWVQPTGTNNGDGSTSNVKIWVTDSAGGSTIASVDQNDYGTGDNMTNGPLNMSVPVTLGHQYYLYVQQAASSSHPATDYYFMTHAVGNASLDTIEAEPNNSVAAPQTVTAQSTNFFGVIGSLTASDEDWFQMDAPSGSTKVGISCSAQRSGSGLRGLTFGLYTASGSNATLVADTQATEVANADANVSSISLPSGTTRYYLKVTASSQASGVTGNYYGCAVGFGQ